ncbi:proprotein convertase P-domain-containing protein [Neolewinella maritima]|uniref:proprotein convertase P-domain-containing protein n=1 Tax=Neolewinella maritima TaxID=1383882 RepID=UPI001EE94FB6|nr:proprotein convertase P-domain-containing protein [Neolewinella maritima]
MSCLVTVLSFGQDIVRIGQTGGEVATCSGRFVDSGGTAGAHAGPGSLQSVTICSDNSDNTNVELSFSVIDIQGTLSFHNGRTSAAPVLRQLTADNNGDRTTISATARNTSGCLTMTFLSSGTKTGWDAAIRCVAACQPIIAVLEQSDPGVGPGPDEFLDACLGEAIALTATGRYPERGVTYPQSDATTTFTWTFGDGSQQVGRSIDQLYAKPGGYLVNVTLRDQRGCESRNRIDQQVRVSGPPDVGPSSQRDLVVCPGEPLVLGVTGVDDAAVTYRSSGRTYGFGSPQPVASRVVIPETANQLRTSVLPLRSFASDQRLGSGDGIVEICVDIEHDYVGDLHLSVECPSGDSVTLLEYQRPPSGAEGQYFGTPTTEPNSPVAGQPGKYCFSASGLLTINDAATSVPSQTKFPEDVLYKPSSLNFSALIGCPLNGDWKLNVLDNGIGNGGTVFNWSIRFQEKLQPPRREFSVPVVTTEWENNDQLSDYSAERIEFTGAGPGRFDQVLTSTDDFGCSYDTLIPVTVRSPYAAGCFSCPPPVVVAARDTVVCLGGSFRARLDLDIPSQVDTIRWAVQTARATQRNAAGQPATLRSTLTVTDQSPDIFTEPARTLTGVCIDYRSSESLASVRFRLVSPGGVRIPLPLPQGAAGSTFNGCIVPTTGSPWTALTNQRINGGWTLEIDDASTSSTGQLLGWSLDLVRESSTMYRWSPASSDFSCTDCENPTVQPTASGTYTLRATTADGCTGSAQLTIDVQNIAAELSADVYAGCAGQNNGSITLPAPSGTMPLSYAWSTGSTERNQSGLAPGTYRLTVTAANGCQDSAVYTVPAPTPLTLEVRSITPVRCFGEATGRFKTSARGGTPPYTFSWSDPSIGPGGDAGAVSAGTYRVRITDNKGCTVDSFLTVPQPARLEVAFDTTPVACRNGSSGALTATGMGGIPPYSYQWSTGAETASISNLTAGTYRLTVTDAVRCTFDTLAVVREPAATFAIALIDTLAPCAGERNGQAAVFASGTVAATYMWSSGESTARATSLAAGLNSVTVTDENGCARALTFSLGVQDSVAPVIQFEGDNVCDPDVPVYLSSATPYASYAWSTGDTTARVGPLTDGETYQLTVTTAQGCSGDTSFRYRASSRITFAVAIDSVQCFGTRTGAIEISSVRGPVSGPYTLEWGESTDFATGPRVDGLLAGDYTVTISNGAQCALDTTFRIPSPDLLILSTRKRDISCFGAIDGTIRTFVSGGSLPYRYIWSNGAFTEQQTGLDRGTYTLQLVDANGCTESDTLVLDSPGEIVVSSTTSSGICGGTASGRIDVLASGGQEPYEYALDGTQFGRSPSFVGVNEGDYSIVVRDTAGCTAVTSIRVEDGPPLTVDLGEDIDLVFGDSVRLQSTVTGSTGPIDYLWEQSEPGGLSCLSCPDPVARPPYVATYTVSVMDSLGCEDSDVITVRVEKIREIAVPTGFTPNEDGSNDRLLVHGRPGTRIESLTIFDRWGGVVFFDEAADWMVNDPDRGWDGTGTNNKPLNAGVYLYKLTVVYEDDSRETLSGQTTLIR